MCNKVHNSEKKTALESTECVVKQKLFSVSVDSGSTGTLQEVGAAESACVFVGGHVLGGADSHVLWRWETDKKVGQRKRKLERSQQPCKKTPD